MQNILHSNEWFERIFTLIELRCVILRYENPSIPISHNFFDKTLFKRDNTMNPAYIII